MTASGQLQRAAGTLGLCWPSGIISISFPYLFAFKTKPKKINDEFRALIFASARSIAVLDEQILTWRLSGTESVTPVKLPGSQASTESFLGKYSKSLHLSEDGVW